MTKMKSYGKKALSIILTLIMCVTLIPLIGDITPEAEAATAGKYKIKVWLDISNGAYSKDETIYVDYYNNNGKGSSPGTVSYSFESLDDGDITKEWDNIDGFPYQVRMYSNGLWWPTGKVEYGINVYVCKAGSSDYQAVHTESDTTRSKSGTGSFTHTATIASGKYPKQSTISWTKSDKTVTVPKSGTTTVTVGTAATVYDQFGVEWYQEPNYAIGITSTPTVTSTTISGVTGTSSQSETCSVSVTNAAKTWVDAGGGNSRDVYISAYSGSATAASTAKVTLNQVQYNVKFYNEGTLLNTSSENQNFYYNDQPYYNGTPTKEADAQYTYVFDGWNTSNENTTTGSPAYTVSNLPVANGDVSYYAHYNKITNQYTVTFKNYDGTTLQSGKLYYGDTPTYEGTPVRESTPQYSYVFTGWTPSISEVTQEATYTAQFEQVLNKYSVVFKNYDGTVLQNSEWDYGSIPSYSETPEKPSDEKYDYVFKGWNPTVNAVTGNAEYTATFNAVKRKFPVVFKNYDGTVLQNTEWEYGTTPSYTGTPVREGNAEYTYTFAGWTPAVVSVTGSAEYTAVFDAKKNEYNVYYKNYDGSAISEEAVVYGEAAQMADSLAPTRPASDGKTYVFAGWSQDLSNITKNTYAVAQYAVEGVENYWVTFVDTDGTVLYKTIVEEGGTAVYGGEEVTKEGYEFVGWDKALNNITEDTTVTALYSKEGEQYVVTYVDWDDTFITSMIVNHGENAVAPADPAREGDENTVYTFSGWDNDGTNVTSNLVIKATYSVHTHEYNTFVENVTTADCVTNRTDKFSCACGLLKDIEIEDSKDADKHAGTLTLTDNQEATCTENGYTGDMVCDACGEVATAGNVIIAPGHTKGEATIENAEDGSCTVPGTYEEVYYCTVCTEPISREKKTGELLPHTPGEIVREKEVAPTCTEDGSYDEVTYCTVCKTETLRTTKVDPMKGHTEETVKGKDATCTETGLTDGIICSVCKETLKEQKEIPANGHTEETVKGEEATCTETGLTDGIICSVCKETLKAQEEIPANGHTEGILIIGKEATCTETGLTDGVKCSVCKETLKEQEEIPANGHTEEIVKGKEATCTETGLTDGIICSVCKVTLKAQEEIPANGHTEETVKGKDATCTETGLTDGIICSVCKETLKEQEEIFATGHSWGEWETETSATCAVDGTEKRVCANDDSHVETRVVNATGEHVYVNEIEKVNASCTENGYVILACGCGAEITETLYATGHKEEAVPAIEATCTETGLTDGIICSVCKETLKEQEEIPANGHTEEIVKGKEATCTETGLTDGIICSVCKETLEEQEEIPANGHTEETVEGKEATCTETGLTDGIICSVCKVTLKAQEEIPANGHTEETVEGKEATCTETGLTDGLKCSVCKETLKEQEEIPANGHTEGILIIGKEATCTETGLTDGVKCSICKVTLKAQEEIPANGHTEETVKGKEATCTETGLTDGIICSVCKVTLKAQEEIPANGHTEETVKGKEATCTETGLTDGIICSVCKVTLKEQEEIPANGHTMGEYVQTKAPTCKEAGERRAECSKCDHFETEEIAKLSHTEETLSAVAPTCTEDGLTEGTKCSVCGDVLVAQRAEPAKGHVWDVWTVVTPATETENGLERRDCKACDKYEERTLYYADSAIVINALDTYYTGRTLPVTASYYPTGNEVKNPQWVSSDDSIVFFSDGRLIAVGVGEVTLTVTDGEFTASKTINVIEGGGSRRVQFVNTDKMHFIIEDYYAIFNSSGFYWAEGEAIRFRVRVYGDFSFETYIVYVDGKPIEADEDGYYTIPADTEWDVVTVQGAGYTEDEDGNKVKKSFWELLLEFFRKIAAFFKGLFA